MLLAGAVNVVVCTGARYTGSIFGRIRSRSQGVSAALLRPGTWTRRPARSLAAARLPQGPEFWHQRVTSAPGGHSRPYTRPPSSLPSPCRPRGSRRRRTSLAAAAPRDSRISIRELRLVVARSLGWGAPWPPVRSRRMARDATAQLASPHLCNLRTPDENPSKPCLPAPRRRGILSLSQMDMVRDHGWRLGHPNAENGTAAKYRGSWGWCAGSRDRRRRAQSPSEPAAGGTNLHERPRVRRAGTPAQGLGPQTQSAGTCPPVAVLERVAFVQVSRR